MRLPFIQCDDGSEGRVYFIAPESISFISSKPLKHKQCYQVSFFQGDKPIGCKTLPNVHNEPELRDWIDFYIRGVGRNDKA